MGVIYEIVAARYLGEFGPSRGKVRKRYEFGVKASITTTNRCRHRRRRESGRAIVALHRAAQSFGWLDFN